jgi:hypothetical protein
MLIILVNFEIFHCKKTIYICLTSNVEIGMNTLLIC